MVTRRLFVFTPGLDANLLDRNGAEGLDEGRGQTTVGDQGDIQVDGRTTDLVAVGELVRGQVLRNVHHHVNLVLMQEIEGGGSSRGSGNAAAYLTRGLGGKGGLS